MKRLILLVSLLGCTAFDYGKALDQCAFDNVGNRDAIEACQCDVAKQNGRSCDFLHMSPTDAGAQ